VARPSHLPAPTCASVFTEDAPMGEDSGTHDRKGDASAAPDRTPFARAPRRLRRRSLRGLQSKFASGHAARSASPPRRVRQPPSFDQREPCHYFSRRPEIGKMPTYKTHTNVQLFWLLDSSFVYSLPPQRGDVSLAYAPETFARSIRNVCVVCQKVSVKVYECTYACTAGSDSAPKTNHQSIMED
jgi:hypothetical protein